MSRHPIVKWAQRSEELSITVELPDAQDVKLKLEPEGKFYFSATVGADKIPYEVDMDLFDNIDVNDSIASASSRHICYLVKKAKNKWWDRLLKQSGKTPSFLKVDWDKWVDEDEYDEQDAKPASDMDFGDIDFSKLNMGGGNGLELDAAGDDDPDDESDSEEEEEDTEEPSSGIELDTKDTVGGNTTVAPDTKA